jgi:opacity protein-like surface antigen
MMVGREWSPVLFIQGGIMRRMSMVGAALMVTVAAISARGDETGTEIDLARFSEIGSSSFAGKDASENPFSDIAYGGGSAVNRFYLTGILGASFASATASGTNDILSIGGDTLSIGQVGSSNQSLFTGGGALGMAIARPMGQLRMEVEGRWRDPVHGTATGFVAVNDVPLATTDLNYRLGTGWSAMTNFWRDVDVTDRFGVYGGGGFGAGGYQYQTMGTLIPGIVNIAGQSTVTTFAWQVGVGGVYKLNDRVEFDAGYRYFALIDGNVPVGVNAAAGPINVSLPLGNFASAFSASELLFAVRIYEPFRNWR